MTPPEELPPFRFSTCQVNLLENQAYSNTCGSVHENQTTWTRPRESDYVDRFTIPTYTTGLIEFKLKRTDPH